MEDKVRQILNEVTESYYVGKLEVTKTDNDPYTTYTVKIYLQIRNYMTIALDALNDDEFYNKICNEFKKRDFGFVKHIKIIKQEC